MKNCPDFLCMFCDICSKENKCDVCTIYTKQCEACLLEYSCREPLNE